MAAFLLFLPAALVVMGCAAYATWRDAPRARSFEQLRACASTACRLSVISSLMLALAGLGCLNGPAAVWGWTMLALGLLGATASYLVSKRYLTDTGRSGTTRDALRRRAD